MMETPSIASTTYGSATSAINLMALNANAFAGGNAQQCFDAAKNIGPIIAIKPENKQMAARRLVKVVIVDSNENVPLGSCVLYSGDEKLTDATDQELFFEIDIKKILDAHNEKRVKLVDKKVKERTEYLEAAKIRDLKMVVVTVASF